MFGDTRPPYGYAVTISLADGTGLNVNAHASSWYVLVASWLSERHWVLLHSQCWCRGRRCSQCFSRRGPPHVGWRESLVGDMYVKPGPAWFMGLEWSSREVGGGGLSGKRREVGRGRLAE